VELRYSTRSKTKEEKANSSNTIDKTSTTPSETIDTLPAETPGIRPDSPERNDC
jgi:hypothetical protein